MRSRPSRSLIVTTPCAQSISSIIATFLPSFQPPVVQGETAVSAKALVGSAPSSCSRCRIASRNALFSTSQSLT